MKLLVAKRMSMTFYIFHHIRLSTLLLNLHLICTCIVVLHMNMMNRNMNNHYNTNTKNKMKVQMVPKDIHHNKCCYIETNCILHQHNKAGFAFNQSSNKNKSRHHQQELNTKGLL